MMALLLLSPLLIAVAAAIAIDSPGNPLYRGWRMGQHGRRFRMWKFRTMVVGADRIGPGITARNDARVTRLGNILRKTKIDELPQLINLLVGDLTLVGPRPEDPEIAGRYTTVQRRVLDYKPGVTGVGALYYTTDQAARIPAGVPADRYYEEHLLDEKLEKEIEYENRRTLISDLHVIWSTVRVMLRALQPRRSA